MPLAFLHRVLAMRVSHLCFHYLGAGRPIYILVPWKDDCAAVALGFYFFLSIADVVNRPFLNTG